MEVVLERNYRQKEGLKMLYVRVVVVRYYHEPGENYGFLNQTETFSRVDNLVWYSLEEFELKRKRIIRLCSTGIEIS